MSNSSTATQFVAITKVTVVFLLVAGCGEIAFRENPLINSPEGDRVISAYYNCAIREARDIANKNPGASELAAVAVSRCQREERALVNLIERAFPNSEYYQSKATDRARQSAYQLALSWIVRGR